MKVSVLVEESGYRVSVEGRDYAVEDVFIDELPLFAEGEGTVLFLEASSVRIEVRGGVQIAKIATLAGELARELSEYLGPR